MSREYRAGCVSDDLDCCVERNKLSPCCCLSHLTTFSTDDFDWLTPRFLPLMHLWPSLPTDAFVAACSSGNVLLFSLFIPHPIDVYCSEAITISSKLELLGFGNHVKILRDTNNIANNIVTFRLWRCF